MPAVLHNHSQMLPKVHASNGARLVSRTGENLPLRGITLTCEAMGGIARTRLCQNFTNAYPHPLELIYSFPLPADGAVADYEIRAGNRLIKGRIERRATARAQFEAARLEGRTGGLVEQERANLFTQHLGNIPGSTDVTIELTIDHPLRWIPGGAWEWRFPTVVAPRYLGAEGVVPDADRVTMDVVNGATSSTASVALTIADDIPVAPTSSTHSVVVSNQTVTVNDAALDRDIVIRWAALRQAPGCTLRTMRVAAGDTTDSDSQYGLLTIVPPVTNGEKFGRDLVLLLDVSGSMDGKPLEHLKAVVTTLIDSLDDDDRLEMIAFASDQVRYRVEPVRATSAERRKARTWVEALRANGGTELISAINETLRPLRIDVPRQVVVVTDGLIGFEAKAVRAVRDNLPQRSRLHSVGVGSASNRAFLRPVARAGRGVEILIDLDDDAVRGAELIVAATREPVVVDVTVQGTALQDAAPRLPDLLTGSPVLAALRLRHAGGTLVVRGNTVHGVWEQHLELQGTPSAGEGHEAIPALWARETIDDLELDLACGGDRTDIDRRIEQIALQYSVSSRLTSWVATSEGPNVDPRDPVRFERIPQALPYGMAVEDIALDAVAAGSAAVLREPSARFHAIASRSRGRREIEREEAADELRDRFGDILQIAMNEMERVQHFLKEIEGSNTLWRKLMRFGLPPRETAARRDELLARVENLAHEMYGIRHTLEPLIADIEHFRETIMARKRPAPNETVPLQGRVLSTPGRPTATIEILVTSGLNWQPAATATIGNRTVDIVEPGTTRPGPIAAGSLIRVELAVAPDVVAQADTMELGCGDGVLIVALNVAD